MTNRAHNSMEKEKLVRVPAVILFGQQDGQQSHARRPRSHLACFMLGSCVTKYCYVWSWFWPAGICACLLMRSANLLLYLHVHLTPTSQGWWPPTLSLLLLEASNVTIVAVASLKSKKCKIPATVLLYQSLQPVLRGCALVLGHIASGAEVWSRDLLMHFHSVHKSER